MPSESLNFFFRFFLLPFSWTVRGGHCSSIIVLACVDVHAANNIPVRKKTSLKTFFLTIMLNGILSCFFTCRYKSAPAPGPPPTQYSVDSDTANNEAAHFPLFLRVHDTIVLGLPGGPPGGCNRTAYAFPEEHTGSPRYLEREYVLARPHGAKFEVGQFIFCTCLFTCGEADRSRHGKCCSCCCCCCCWGDHSHFTSLMYTQKGCEKKKNFIQKYVWKRKKK